jgi:FkbM family methyltransferase
MLARLRRGARVLLEAGLDRATRHTGVKRTVNGLPYRVTASSRHWFQPTYDGQVAAFLRARIQPGAVCCNAGANVGVYALQLAAWAGPSGRVYTFEPNPAAAAELRRNIHLSRLDARVEVIEAAVGDAPGTATFYASGSDPMGRMERPNPLLVETESFQVPVVSLDEYFRSRDVSPAWVVMDIEGSEIAALRGMRWLLRPPTGVRLVAELHPDAWSWSSDSRAQLEALLAGLELRPVALTGQRDPLAEHGMVYFAPPSDPTHSP